MARWRARVAGHAAVGAVAGPAWAAALRSYMAEISGYSSAVEWVGTFVGVLLPGALVGACLAAAAVIPVPAGHTARLRWLAASPLLFALFPLALPDGLVSLLTAGLGGGAIALALGGIAGGYALGGGRRLWLRIACGVLAGALVVCLALTAPLIGGIRLGFGTPRGAWVALLAASLMIVLCIACAIPFRRLVRLAPAGADSVDETRAPSAERPRVSP